MLRDKRFLLVCCVTVLLAAQFWAGSRYPALNEKASMGADAPLSGLAFSTLVDVAPDAPVVERILYATVNWTYTNRQGMTFGILFGALLLTLLRLLERRSLDSAIGNTVMGMLIGTPLGVCANCAVPIAKGIYAAGAKTETMLAAMVSSPTLNVIVLTMLFALFPAYMVVIKIGLTLAFILIGIPLLTWVFPASSATAIDAGAGTSSPPTPAGTEPATPLQRDTFPPGQVQTWRKATQWVVQTLAANLWFIIKTTVPLMLLAGLLGSALITVLPFDSLAAILPTTGQLKILLGMGGMALLGLLLPVPMAFDVIVTAILWHAGMPVKYAMVLLFTLGIFSVYPFFILWRAIGPRLATSLFLALAALGFLAGLLGHEVSQWDFRRQQQLVFEVFRGSSASLHGPQVLRVGGETRVEMADRALVSTLQSRASTAQPWLSGRDGVSVERVPFQIPRGHDGVPARPEKLFSRFEGSQWGLDEPYSFSVLNFAGPSVLFRGIASGDVHNDGRVDLLLTSESGPSLYASREGRGFVLQQMDIPALRNFHVVNAALVDLDNDGWLDIYFSTYRHGNYFIRNAKGRFTNENLHRLPDQPGGVMTGAAAFGDVDKDGDLDIVLGAWTPVYNAGSAITGNKVMLRNDNGRFKVQSLDEIPGPALMLQSRREGNRSVVEPNRELPGSNLSRRTLSVLLSDINNDGNLDLIFGNEEIFSPDSYFFGNGDGSFRPITRKAGVIPYSTATTMSVASADIDNDLLPEMYVGQISGSNGKTASRDLGPDICDEMVRPAHKKNCLAMIRAHQSMPRSVRKAEVALDVRKCLSMDAGQYREDCIAYSLLVWTIRNGSQDLCNLFAGPWESFRFMCHLDHDEKIRSAAAAPGSDKMPGSPKGVQDGAIPALFDNNVLLSQTGDGRFADKAHELGVQKAGYTWNAKFADLDNDGFQDLYAVNGSFPTSKRESHVFYQNQQGKRFLDRTEEAGLVSFLATSSYTYVDVDDDGDLDIVLVPIAGPVLVYVNNSRKNRIAVELRDHRGNRFGIGSKVIIHGAGNSLHQVREIQAGGGFISFDAPIAYFGLGDIHRVERIEVHWSTGERSEIRGDFPAGFRYVVTRQ